MFGNFEQSVAIIGGLVGLTGSAAAVITWYRSVVRKEYAAQRDFSHLKNNYETLSNAFEDAVKDQDLRFDRLDLSQARVESKLDATLQAFSYRKPNE